MTRVRVRALATSGAWHAAAAYGAMALVGTWPLARGLGRDVPSDLGEPLLAMWALAWGCEQLLAILGGDLSRVATFFDANIFHPAPLTLAYSEPFIAQAVQVLPVYAMTHNPILCYNLLFLSTFVLSGLGTYLFVRELTGNRFAAFLAGVLFAFAPYRLGQISHLQVLSAQWMPFALYCVRRYFQSVDGRGRGRIAPLAGAAGAMVAQSLSSVYYTVYFAPFAVAYVLWEIATRRAWRQWRAWMPVASAAGIVVVTTVPFLLPYAAVRPALSFAASQSAVVRSSADVYSYATASEQQPVWGQTLRAFPKDEGDLFPGLVALLLGIIGVGGPGKRALETAGTRVSASPSLRPPDVMAIVAGVLAVLHLGAAGAALLYRRVTIDLGWFDISISNINQLLLRAAVLIAIALALSPPARRAAGTVMRGPGFFLLALLAAVWLSLGPVPQALGRPIELVAPYRLLYDYLPGVDSLRVPSRFGMIAVLMLGVLGGFGAAVLSRGRRGRLLVPVLGLLFLVESLSLPFPVNAPATRPGLTRVNGLDARVYRPGRAPAVYREIARLPAGAVIAELPLGDRELDSRAMFYSAVHWRPLLNGYGEIFPRHYDSLAVAVSDVPRHADAALDALRAAGTTHVLVHEGASAAGDGASTTAALLERGATELFRDGAHVLLELEDGS